jgi:hypothetical protein
MKRRIVIVLPCLANESRLNEAPQITGETNYVHFQ